MITLKGGSLEDIKVKFSPQNENNLNSSIEKPPESKEALDFDIEEKRVKVSLQQEQFEREKADRQLRDKYSFKALETLSSAN